MAGESDKTAIIQQPPRDSAVYHIPQGDVPRCGVSLTYGEWTTVPVEDVPTGLSGCKRCSKASEEPDEGPTSLLVRARLGTPEDFGLVPLPESPAKR